MSMKKNKIIAVFDMEANGLLDEVTKIHCLSANFYVGGKWVMKSTTDYDEMRKFFRETDVIVCHNLVRYDIPLAETILGIKVECEVVDTIMLSYYLYPYEKVHGLAHWGNKLGIKKPEVEDWEGLTSEEYIHRCEEDVKINTKLYLKFLRYLKKIYKRKGDYWRLIRYLNKKIYEVRLQERDGWEVDKEKLFSNFSRFGKALEEAKEKLEDAMPPNPLYKTRSKPKQKYKKNGEMASRYEKWRKLLEDNGVDPDTYEGDKFKFVHDHERGNSQSHVQVKSWLFDLGWEPATYDYKKDDKEDDGFRKIPQVRDGKELCKSVKKLIPKAPEIKLLETYTVIKHRWDIFKGLLENIDENNRVKAEVTGLTNTMRFKHKTLVNLPGVTHKGDWGDGVHVRGLLKAKDGCELCGSDMSSLEDTTKQHYIYPYDPDYVEDMRVPGFDPHLDIGVVAGMISKEDEAFHKKWKDDMSDGVVEDEEIIKRFNKIDETRKGTKIVNFSATYGVGALTLSRQSDLTFKKSEDLLEVYWKRNWAIKEVEKSSLVQEVNGQLWLYNPVAKLWYFLKNEKDIFSTLNQGTGAFCFDVWVFNILSKRDQLCGQFHDEIILEVEKGERDYIKKLLKWAIKKTNKQLKLRVPLDVDIQFGDNYAQIH